MLKTLRFFIYLFLILCSLNISAKNIYVAITGNDANDGTINNPFKTFSKAISVMSAGDICIIREGVYEEELSISKNGTAGNYLTFKAADGETVDIKATSVINGWQVHNGSIYKANVNMSIANRFRAIYHNNEFMDLARWPNNTDNNRWTLNTVPVTGGDGSNFTVASIPNVDWTGGYVYYLGAHSGASWTRAITENTVTSITHTGVDITKWPFTPHNPTVWRNNPGNERGQLYLFNKLEALDYANEWYYDGASNTLYLQTADGSIPADDSVQYATRQYAAQLKGDYIKLEGINFFGGSIKIHNNADNNQIISCKIEHGAEGHDSLTNTSAQEGDSSIEILGANTIVRGCTINHSSMNGITIANWAGAHNCIIEENFISNIDYNGIHTKPINSGANNTKVLKNTIWNAGRDGMTVGGLDSEIAYNDVSHSQLINSDSGIFYTVGNNDLKNIELHHNWFHDATAPSYSHAVGDPGKAAGIYLDNNSKGYIVHHNVVWNISWSGYQVNWNNTNLDFFHNTIWNAERAMDAWVNGYTQENNKVYNNFASSGAWFTETSTDFDIQNNLITSTSPFEDANNQNFMPSSGSAITDAGMVISGFEKPFKGIAPDIGAYERFGTRWTAGVNAIEDSGEGKILSVLDTQFTITTTSETCPDENNGKINIVADVSQDYIVSVNNVDTNFTNEINIEELEPGIYELCISVKDFEESQCFNFEINESSEISGKTSIESKQLSVNMDLGTAPFTVFINNNKQYETYNQSFVIDVNQGDEVKITSNKDCEGEIVEVVDFEEDIIAYPNSTSGDFQLVLPKNEGNIFVELYDLNSRLLSSKLYLIESGRINLSLKNKPSGIYIARVMSKNPVSVKIIKK
ncbi:T9SS type A sorting domain-containing protein [Lutibacter citreus]|uniref:T9SS type A sorting domain-containing protein n=1 Tax=Lutibacter citreus TaxID=2138210 RepID=UPI000DBE1697|nr:T9SS type A sorting domain-containing protein [Lutibacter citreus]